MKMNRHTLAIGLLACLATPPLAHAAEGQVAHPREIADLILTAAGRKE
jgi:hypothetical protein